MLSSIVLPTIFWIFCALEYCSTCGCKGAISIPVPITSMAAGYPTWTPTNDTSWWGLQCKKIRKRFSISVNCIWILGFAGLWKVSYKKKGKGLICKMKDRKLIDQVSECNPQRHLRVNFKRTHIRYFFLMIIQHCSLPELLENLNTGCIVNILKTWKQ